MESVIDILFAMRTRGIKIGIRDGQLVYEATRGAIDRSAIETLRARKLDIIEFLNQAHPLVPVAPPLKRRAPHQRAPLTPMQRSYFARVAATGGKSRRGPTILTRLLGDLDVQSLERALLALLRRHEILRVRIATAGDVPTLETQELHEFRLATLHVTGDSLPAREIAAKQMIRELVTEPFFQQTDPLLMTRLLVLGPQDHVLLVAMDHMLFDLLSVDILLRDLLACYAHEAHGAPLSLPSVGLQFPDYAAWLATLCSAAHGARDTYWTERLSGARHLRVFTDSTQSAGSPRVARLRFLFDPSLTLALRRFSAQRRTTLMMTLLTAYVATLFRWCNDDDVVLQVTTTARRYPQLENTVGVLVTVLYLRFAIRQHLSFDALLAQVISTYNDAYEHDDFGRLAAQRPRPPFASNPGFNFNSLPAPSSPAHHPSRSGGLEFSPFPVSLPFGDDFAVVTEEPQLFVLDSNDELGGSFAYRADQVRVATMKRFEQSLQAVARRMTEKSAAEVACVAVATAD